MNNNDNDNKNDDFEVSFIFSIDELYTLMLSSGEPSEAGKNFINEVLAGAVQSDLSELPAKKMAYEQDGKIFIEPVIRMLGASICKAEKIDFIDSEDKNGGVYIISSKWVKVKCERYLKIDGCVKLTPLKPDI